MTFTLTAADSNADVDSQTVEIEIPWTKEQKYGGCGLFKILHWKQGRGAAQPIAPQTGTNTGLTYTVISLTNA